jgi:hypothetical protein
MRGQFFNINPLEVNLTPKLNALISLEDWSGYWGEGGNFTLGSKVASK